ncbi:hypothetical protein ACLK1T_26080 [Escherichia coli]
MRRHYNQQHITGALLQRGHFTVDTFTTVVRDESRIVSPGCGQ